MRSVARGSPRLRPVRQRGQRSARTRICKTSLGAFLCWKLALGTPPPGVAPSGSSQKPGSEPERARRPGYAGRTSPQQAFKGPARATLCNGFA